MQDGYHFAAAPWLIGDGLSSDAAGETGSGDAGLQDQRRGQVVRIVHEPAVQTVPTSAPVSAMNPAAPIMAVPATAAGAGLSPIVLNPADRLPLADGALRSGLIVESGATGPAPTSVAPDAPDTVTAMFSALFEGLASRQDAALARIEASQAQGLARIAAQIGETRAAPADTGLPERLDLTLATLTQARVEQADALHEVATVFDALSDQISSLPHLNDRLLRDMADMRASLTELRVQMRVIEMGLFAANRGLPTAHSAEVQSAAPQVALAS